MIKLIYAIIVQKVVGSTFYLPLPLEETIKKICNETDTINMNPEFYILVNSIPNKNKQIWQNLVDVSKILKGLTHLKSINHLYSNINIPSTIEVTNILKQLPDLAHLEINKKENSEPKNQLTKVKQQKTLPELENLESDFEEENEIDKHEIQSIEMDQSPNLKNNIEIKSKNRKEIDIDGKHIGFLTQTSQSSSFYENYTIYPLHEDRKNETATSLYQQVKVYDIPLNNSTKYLDALCFPLLFPTGKNCQHDYRPVPIRDSDFIKTKLLSANPRYRLNKQYLFHLLHDCNLRQLNQGIF